MKKIIWLGLVTLLVMSLSIGAFAVEEGGGTGDFGPIDTDMEPGDGWAGYFGLDEEDLDGEYADSVTGDYYIVEDIENRESYNPDLNGTTGSKDNPQGPDNDQDVSVTVDAVAFIPCYIEMEVEGNGALSTVRSYGPDAAPTVDHALPIVFDNAVGGFVDEDWHSLGHGDNAEVALAEGVYIQACDVFRVTAWANEDYMYQVESTGLTAAANGGPADSSLVLPLDMRWTDVGAGVWPAANQFTFDAANDTKVIDDDIAALTGIDCYHQFRVPVDSAHGAYEGEITFRCVSI